MKIDDDKTWDLTYAHFKDGYKNAQDAIRFVDTKTGALTGLLTLTTALPFTLFKWSMSLDAKCESNFHSFNAAYPYSCGLLFAFFIIGIFIGMLGITSGITGLVPRQPKKYYHGVKGTFSRWRDIFLNQHKKKNDKPPITILFPYFEGNCETVAKKYIHEAAKGLTKKTIITEYESQIAQVGRILCIKISWNRRSALFLKLQIATYVAAVAVTYISVNWYLL